jgi:hypothetical protein
MAAPLAIGLGIASLAGGLMSGRANRRAQSRLRRQERKEIELQRGELADAREAFGEEQDLIARSIANALANRGISNSSIADETRDRFVAQRARGDRALDRQHQRLEAGITTRNIQNDLQTAMQRANQLQNAIGLIGLTTQFLGQGGGTAGDFGGSAGSAAANIVGR